MKNSTSLREENDPFPTQYNRREGTLQVEKEVGVIHLSEEGRDDSFDFVSLLLKVSEVVRYKTKVRRKIPTYLKDTRIDSGKRE